MRRCEQRGRNGEGEGSVVGGRCRIGVRAGVRKGVVWTAASEGWRVGRSEGRLDNHDDNLSTASDASSAETRCAIRARHQSRIRTAYFGALRGRNDLEHRPEDPIACHIVAGSPKTTEEDRRQLALAVYGRKVLPFPELETVRRQVTGHIPSELVDGDEERSRLWEVRIKGYSDPRMQAVYDHTVTAELTHAADRARVLTHRSALVYLVTNEPCPRLWFAEKCFAGDLLDLSGTRRSDHEARYKAYEDKALELLNRGETISNADVCKALGQRNYQGWRYWSRFHEKYEDALVGRRKVRWKEDS